MEKQRLDRLLLDKGLFESRERARIAVTEGAVYVDGTQVTKPSTQVSEDAVIEIRGETLRYVSRGGLKLQGAIEAFGLDLTGVTALDIGASTGGFTDCMLQHGATHVYAVDVGTGQLAQKLREDPRVTGMEQTDIRTVQHGQLDEVSFATVDVSFISVRLILPALRLLLSPGGRAVVLIKPQFEAGRGNIGKHGVVRDRSVHREVLDSFLAAAQSEGFGVLALTYSPVQGGDGNIEYLALLEKGAESIPFDTDALVGSSHINFRKGN